METVKLIESGLGLKKGTGQRRRARIIEGNRWGSSAYYPAEVLERDGPRVIIPGVLMFENHLTDSEQWERPEGDVGKLVGKVISESIYEHDNPDGPGLYADVEFYESYVPRINEIGSDIGLSVRASGITEDAEMEGRYGPVLVSLLAVESVDVVTRAGAGGKLTSILEADRVTAGTPVNTKEGQSVTVTKEDFEGLSATILEAIKAIPAGLAEALKPVEEPKAEGAPDAEAVVPVVEAEVEEKIEVDGAAVLVAVNEAQLPTVTIKSIYAAVQEGVSIEDAVAAQVALREAFAATTGEGVFHFAESQGSAPAPGSEAAVKAALAKAVVDLG